MKESKMRKEWRWLMLGALGAALFAHLLARSRSKLSAADAAVYGSELKRMQDA
jgi:hypothetical protein